MVSEPSPSNANDTPSATDWAAKAFFEVSLKPLSSTVPALFVTSNVDVAFLPSFAVTVTVQVSSVVPV